MADRGLTIRDLLTKKGVKLNMPPFTKGQEIRATFPCNLWRNIVTCKATMLHHKVARKCCLYYLAFKVTNAGFAIS